MPIPPRLLPKAGCRSLRPGTRATIARALRNALDYGSHAVMFGSVKDDSLRRLIEDLPE
jgi:hypothetical protein